MGTWTRILAASLGNDQKIVNIVCCHVRTRNENLNTNMCGSSSCRVICLSLRCQDRVCIPGYLYHCLTSKSVVYVWHELWYIMCILCMRFVRSGDHTAVIVSLLAAVMRL